MRRRRQRGAVDVDITPLIDVLFMLIIFFVLTASFSQGQIAVELPNGGGAAVEGETVTLIIEKSGGLLWNGSEVARSELADLAHAAGGREIIIAGDREAPYGDVAEVLEMLRREGVESAGLLLRERAVTDDLPQ